MAGIEAIARVSGKPPWIWCRIVKAVSGPVAEAPLLSSTEKLVFAEIMGLCQTRGGATIGAGALGRRLGLTGPSGTRTIERARKELVAVGLLERKDRGEGRTAAWLPTMPEICRPKCRRLDEDQLETFAIRLAHHIMRKRARTGATGVGGESEGPLLAVV